MKTVRPRPCRRQFVGLRISAVPTVPRATSMLENLRRGWDGYDRAKVGLRVFLGSSSVLLSPSYFRYSLTHIFWRSIQKFRSKYSGWAQYRARLSRHRRRRACIYLVASTPLYHHTSVAYRAATSRCPPPKIGTET